MKPDRSFHDHVVYDLMADTSGVTSRAMFGGWGIYKEGVIFAIIADGDLYFKVGANNRDDFEKAGSRPFTYTQGKRKPVAMSYWLLPESVMEDREMLGEWVARSLQASNQSKRSKSR